MHVHLFTYATHSHGTFDALVLANLHIQVLGWGCVWRGFFDKIVAMERAVSAMPPDDLVVFVDAFDTSVTSLRDVIRTFETRPSLEIVFSKHVPPISIPFLSDYVVRRQFLGTINSGTYAGRVRSLRLLFSECLNVRSDCRGDDQRAFNVVARRHPEWIVDEARLLFDVRSVWDVSAPRALICHRPGSTGTRRVLQGLFQYLPFFEREMAMVAAVIVWWLVRW